MAKIQETNPAAGRKNSRVPLATVAKNILGALRLNKKYKEFLASKQPTPTPATYFGVTKIPPEKLFINYKAQRWPIILHILKLIVTWVPEAATPLFCRSDKKTGKYFIMDGQQHAIAWYILFGAGQDIPCSGIEADADIEAKVCHLLNAGQEKMSAYHEHMLAVEDGQDDAVARNDSVINAGCTFVPYKHKAKGISHFKDFYKFETEFSLDNVEYVLSRCAYHYSNYPIRTATLGGLLRVMEIMKASNQFTDDNFDNVIECCIEWTESPDDLHKAIKQEFKISEQIGTGHSVVDQVASGIINIFNRTNATSIKLDPPYVLRMPIMKPEFVQKGLHPHYDESTYLTKALWRHVCETGDTSRVWAYANHAKWLDANGESDFEAFHKLCNSHCECGTELSYCLGDNIGGTTRLNAPQADHKDPKAKGGKNLLSNCEVMCEICNAMKNSATHENIPQAEAVLDRLKKQKKELA